jgi:hypothetical protein
MPFQLATRRMIPTNNRELETLIRYVSDPVDQLLSLPILNGRLLTDVQITTTGGQAIEHKLQRPYRGYIVVNQNGPGNFSTAPTTPVDRPELFINLVSSVSPVTISLWVF